MVYTGYRLRGGAGALGALLPLFVFIVLLSIACFQWGQMPAVNKLFMGFVPAVTAIIASTAWNMGRNAVARWREGVLTSVSAGVLLGVGGFYSTPAIILVAGLAGWWRFRATARSAGAASDMAAPPTRSRRSTRTGLLLVQPRTMWRRY